MKKTNSVGSTRSVGSKKTSKKPSATKVVKVFNRSKYNIVDGSTSLVQDITPDNKSEDQVLNASKRSMLRTLTRNLVRNSSLFNTILGQLTTNVVSTCGGKVILSIPNETTNSDLRWQFSKYTRNVDFYTGDTFNHFLKRVLREYVIGGDVVIVFDDGLVEDSGKLLIFESNEIVNVSQSEVEKRYGKGSWISQGKVYSPNGRHIGTVVSKSQKDISSIGGDVDPSKCYFLRKDPNANNLDNYWFHFSSNWREGRGVSQAASSISTIHQLEDLVQSELLASRRNSQVFCFLTQQQQPDAFIPSAFDETTDFSSMSDEEIKAAIASNEEDVKTISFRKAQENSIVYEALPEGFNAQQLSTQHPNSNVEVMVDWLANRCAASMGLSKVFATGNPEDGNWRSNQLFSYPAILELQKDLEQITDWCFNRWVIWARRKGLVKSYISEDFMDYVDWCWKSIDSLDPVANENAISLQLKNMTKTYKEVLGNDWKEKMKQVAYERKWMIENGITPPQDLMLSGGQTESSKGVQETSEQV